MQKNTILDNHQNNTLHYFASEKKYDEILHVLAKYDFYINLVNNDNKTFIHNIDDADFLFNLLVKYHNKLNLKTFDYSSLFKNAILNYHINHKYSKIIIFLLKKKFIKYIDLFGIFKLCINNNLFDIFSLLFNNGVNVDYLNNKQYTILMYSIKKNNYNATKILLKYNPNINYSGVLLNKFPINIAIKNKNFDMINLLLNCNIDYDIIDNYLNTPIHNYLLMCQENNIIDDNITSNFILNSNLNIHNFEYITPFCIIIKYAMFHKFIELLKNKKIIFIKNNKNHKIFDSICNHIISYKLEFLLNKYDIVIQDTNISNYKFDKICKKNKNTNDMHIPSTKKSYFGLFNSNIFHNIIYFVSFLKKFKNIGFPILANKNDFFNELFVMSKICNGLTSCKIIAILNEYNLYYPKLIPFIIIWKDIYSYFIYEYIDKCIELLLSNKKIIYIVIKLTIIIDDDTTHAGILIYDKNKNSLIRFESFGYMQNQNDLDFFLFEKFKKLINKNITYITPNNYLKNIKFQLFSNDFELKNKQLGDPQGYCVVWTLWFLELYISNENANLHDLINNAFYVIVNDCDNIVKCIMKYIRNYSRKIDSWKNKFLIQSGIEIDNVYNMQIENNDLYKISAYIDYIIAST
jgi:hypothetical protein